MELVNPKDMLGVPYLDNHRWWINAVAHADLTKGKPYAVQPANAPAAIPEIDAALADNIGGVTAAPSTLAVLHYVGVPQRDFDQYAVAKLQIGGPGEMLVDGSTAVTKADFLEVINAGVAAIKDGTSRSVNSLAMAKEAQAVASAVLIDVEFLSLPVQVAAA